MTGQISAGAMAELHMNSTCVTSHWSRMVSTLGRAASGLSSVKDSYLELGTDELGQQGSTGECTY